MKKWLDKYEAPKAQNGIEGTMGGLTDIGFNYNGAWGGQFAMGGNLPGTTGMMYARTAGAAPANGPYAKKTKASAQNGMEMKYYQEGLDFKPKTISQDGTRVVIPKRDLRTLAEAEAERRLANQPVIQSPKGRQLTKEEINQKNKKYAQQTGKKYNEKSGAVEDRFTPSQERVMNRAVENIIEPMTIIEGGVATAPLVKKGLRSAGKYLTEKTALKNTYELNPSLKRYKLIETPSVDNIDEGFIPPPQQAGFINFKGAFQKYPKGPLTEEEIAAYRNSQQYQRVTKEHADAVNKYGDKWKLGNYMEDALQKAIATGNRSWVNPQLYGGRNWNAADYTLAGLMGTAFPGVMGLHALVWSPPAVRSKVMKNIGIPGVPGGLSSRDTIIDITNRPMDFAKVNETKDGQIIIGGEFIEDANNTVRKAKDWLTATDTYSDKEYSSKDIQSFYGIENGKFKVGKANEFKQDTEIVPRRFGAININKAVLNGNEMRLLDNEGNPIYQNTPNTGKFILYSPSTGKAQFTYINTGKSGVEKVNNFLKKNKDAQYIHLDNGRYEYYGINPEGLTEQDFKNYYEQDLKREGNPGYNMIIKRNGGGINKYGDITKAQNGSEIVKDDMGYWNPDNWGKPVEIGSNVITMEGVDVPLIGISDTGDIQYMEPGEEEYVFDGETVTEYPVARNGINQADAQPIKKLDQSLNFTNYNKPTKGGWLNKYK